jgi:hypothetical protein
VGPSVYVGVVSSGPSGDDYKEEERPRRLSWNQRCYYLLQVIVDRLTKTGLFIPTTSNYTAETIAELCIENVVRRGWIPDKLITDRDAKLVRSFWKKLAKRLRFDHWLTAAWHAQTDGAAERLSQTLEVAIRAYIEPRQDNWAKELPLLKLAYNTAKNAVTGFSPYELLYIQPHDHIKRLIYRDSSNEGVIVRK